MLEFYMPRKRSQKHSDESFHPGSGAGPPYDLNLQVLKRQAAYYLRKSHPEEEADLIAQAIAEGITALFEKYPEGTWKCQPFKKALNTIVGAASNWLRRNRCLIPLSNFLPPSSLEDTDSSEEEWLFPDSTLTPDEMVAYRCDLVWLLQHLSPDELVIVLARWLDFEYSEIATILTKREATPTDVVNLRQTYHRLRTRMLTILRKAGYHVADIERHRIGKHRPTT